MTAAKRTRKPKPNPLTLQLPPSTEDISWVVRDLKERGVNSVLWLQTWLDDGRPGEPYPAEHHIIAEKLAPIRDILKNADEEALALVRGAIEQRLKEEGHMPVGSSLPPPADTPAPLTVSQMVESYIKLRDKRDQIKEEHKKQLAPYTDMMAKVEGFLMEALSQAGVESMKGEAGTVYMTTETSVSVKDWPLTFAYIREHQLWDLLEARVSKSAALAVIGETQAPIPGVTVSSIQGLRVRRS